MPGFAITVVLNCDDADQAEVVRGKVAGLFQPPMTIAAIGVGVAQVSDDDLT